MSHRVMSAIAAGSLILLALTACDRAEDTAQAPASAQTALDRMGLIEGGNDRIAFAGMNERDGRYVFTDVVIRGTQDDDDESEGPKDIFAERMILDRPRIADDRVTMEAFSLEGITASSGEEGGTLSLDRFGIDAPNEALAADIARFLAGGNNDEIDADWSSYAFGSLSAEAFSATSESEHGPVRMALEQFVVQEYADVELGRLAFTGFELEAATAEGPTLVRLGDLSILGLKTGVYIDMMDAMSAGEGDAAVFDAYSRSLLTTPTDMFERFTVRDMAVSTSGIGMTLDEMTGAIAESGSLLRSEMEIGSAILTADPAQPGGAEVAMALGMLGYDRLELTLKSRSVYDAETGRAYTEGENYIELRDGVRIEFQQDMSGYDAYLEAVGQMVENGSETVDLAAAEEATSDAMMALILNSMSVRIVDLSLLDRALEAGAASQGLTKEQLRMQTAALIGMGLMAAPAEIPRPLLAELSTALTTFVNQGGSLTIAVEPAEPMSLGELTSRAEAGTLDVRTLGLTAATQPPE